MECALQYIYPKKKVDKILGEIKGVKTYINDILVLIKGRFSKNIEQLKTIFFRLRSSGLKVNATKCIFGCNIGLKDITYLGSVITQDGIKPDTNKLKGIMDLRGPTTTTEARALIGMVQ